MATSRLVLVGFLLGGLLAAPILIAQVMPGKVPTTGGGQPVPAAASATNAPSIKHGPVVGPPSASPEAGVGAPPASTAGGGSPGAGSPSPGPTEPAGASPGASPEPMSSAELGAPSESPEPSSMPSGAPVSEGGRVGAGGAGGGGFSTRPLSPSELRVEEFRRRAEVGRDLRRRDARPKILAIRDLMLIGKRADQARFFDEAKDSYERARAATKDLIDKWKSFLDELTGEASDEIRLQPWFTQVFAEVMGEVLALRAMLREIYPNLADVYVAKGLYQQAVEELTLATNLDPSDPALWLSKARAEQLKEDYDASIPDFFKSVRLDPWQPVAYYDLTKSYAKKGDVKTALVYLRRAISLGYNRFDEIAIDDDLASLHGDPQFEEMVYIGPSAPY